MFLRRNIALAVAPLALAAAFSGCAQNSASSTAAQASAAAVLDRAPASPNDGGRVYTQNCASCHMADGNGVMGLFPPLDGNPLVVGDPAHTIAIVKYGMSGRIAVDGHGYNGTMPRWGQLISDQDIAAVVSYIRISWHNRAGPVSTADVRAVPPVVR